MVAPPPGERNYHAFYHMLAGAGEAVRSEYGLGSASNKNFHYTAAEAKSDGIDDEALWVDVS